MLVTREECGVTRVDDPNLFVWNFVPDCSYVKTVVTKLLMGNSKGRHLGMVKMVEAEELAGYKGNLSLEAA